MIIRTKRPVYSYAEGDGKAEAFEKIKAKFKELKDSGKLKEWGSKLGQSGVLKGLFQGRNKNQQVTPTQQAIPTEQKEKKDGMSTTTKVLIGVGVGLTLLTIVYLATKKSTPVIITNK